MERKRVKGYHVAAALLLLWAAADFYHCFYSGGNLIAYYLDLSNVRPLLGNKLFRGIVKTALGLVVFAVGWFRGKEKPRPRSLTAATAWTALAVLGCWLASMACATVVTAQEIYDKLYEASYDFPDYVSRTGLLDEFYDQSLSRYGYHHERPDFWENRLLEAIARNTSARYWSEGDYGNGERSKLIRDIDYLMETAVLFYDGEGNLLHSSEEDILYFNYFTQEEWDAGMDTTSGLHYGWMDISEGKDAADPEEDPWHLLRQLYAETGFPWGPILRVVGTFDGTELIPVTVHYVTDEQIRQVVESTDQFSTGPGSYSYIVSDVDRTGRLEWKLLFDRDGEHKEEDLATFYLDRPDMWDYQGTPLRYNGTAYESLAALTEDLDFPSEAGVSLYSSELREAGIFQLDELLVFAGWDYADYEGYDYSAGGEPETEFTMITAIRSNPLACAVSALRNIYIATGLLALVLLVTVRSRIRQHLVTPVTAVVEAMEDNWKNIYRPESAPAPWAEAQRLGDGYAAEQDRRRMKDNEITRLNTALTYAKEAETERRQMTSHMAHELKTPLAVIHCCCEGLREDIAPEKRQQYLDTILSEAEELDAMVLEMLDLSRLEAGKVKLSRDDFDLAEMARAVFRRLEAAAADRELTVELSCGDPCPVSADEGRLRQAMGNLAANAVRYAPAGSTVRARVWREGNWTCFAVENDSPPFTRDELEKIWERFYRREEDRSGRGTGLGLAITRQIVELHGGRCRAENIPGGVRFQLSVPN
mgnify:FL=1